MAESAGGGVRAALAGQLDLGYRSACLVEQDGDVRCWGHGQYGKLGSRATDPRLNGVITGGTDDASVVPLGGPARSVSASQGHACAVMVNGAVRCWGRNTFATLGTGTAGTDHRLDGTLVGGTDEASIVPLGGPAKGVSTGVTHTCAVLENGAVRCWGTGSEGQLGSRATDNRLDGVVDPATGTDEASVVPLGGPAKAVSVGALHSCALLENGDVRCWGYNADAELGSGSSDFRLDGIVDPGSGTDEASTPVTGAVAISGRSDTVCAVLATGATRCWGWGGHGAAGSGATDTIYGGAGDPPATVPIEPASGISVGYEHACALVTGGVVRCWGDGTNGRLGSGATDDRLDEPGDEASVVPLPEPAAAVAVGELASCALLRSGRVHCWGSAAAGMLGNGTGAGDVLDEPGEETTAVPVDAAFGRITDLSLSVSAPLAPPTGARFVLTVRIVNDGPDPAAETSAAITLPAGLELLDHDAASGSFDGTTWTVPSVPAEGSVVLRLGVRTPTAAAGTPLSVGVAVPAPDGALTPGGQQPLAATGGTAITPAAPPPPAPAPDPAPADPASDGDNTPPAPAERSQAPAPTPEITPGDSAPVAVSAPAAGSTRIAVRGTAQLSRRAMRVGERTTLRLRLRNTGSSRSTATRSCVRLSPRLRLVGRPIAATLSGRLLCFAIPPLEPDARLTRTAKLRATAAASGAVTRDGTRDETAIRAGRVVITGR